MVRAAPLALLLVAGGALGDSSPPPRAPAAPAAPAPTCRSPTWGRLAGALDRWCRRHPERGPHGRCVDWLRAFRRCDGAVTLEREGPALVARLELYQCHAVIVEFVPQGGGWAVRGTRLLSHMPPPLRDPQRLEEPELAPDPT